MSFVSTILNAVGLIFLTHAVYSAHEHTALSSTSQSSASGTPANPASSLPLDIVIELLVAVVVLSIGIVLSSTPLKPIQWNKWAGAIEKNGRKENPYRILEERVGFWDVRS
ncbi:hypothetical protein EJ05DRAFT_174202 [Pseudovirgaria hyperparasitica]|uniref:Magnesium transporter n=1 Tax=Pseudovirgaria hyperparasitica TaxID=470096 RepID=A0A6A6WHE2_9PEZI|nr:uncharacterized protein EJ05DRAFT_174202 [Pseudovirgaria hyperparasitica]KAF2761504.1 hypothetical protein EJ05DRAFT_174202 [Pseudovirgaria hyperparasitica]